MRGGRQKGGKEEEWNGKEKEEEGRGREEGRRGGRETEGSGGRGQGEGEGQGRPLGGLSGPIAHQSCVRLGALIAT